MDLHDNTISWMIGGGRRGDPEELRNLAHLRALHLGEARPSLTERVRGLFGGSAPVTVASVDSVCCVA